MATQEPTMTPFDLAQFDVSGDVRQVADDAGLMDEGGTRRKLLRDAGITVAGAGLLTGILSPLEAFAAAGGATGAYSTTRKSAANDLKIGNFALTLEYLEAAFYKQAHDSGALTDPDISGFAGKLAEHEAAHVKALKGILGAKAVSSPKVNFGSAVTDQNVFMMTANALEPVGTAAYQGAGPYIHSPTIVKAALSILPVEANHAAYAATLGKLKGILPDADPAPFAFRRPNGYNATLKKVTATHFVTGNLHP
jgi:Ferritin-like domain